MSEETIRRAVVEADVRQTSTAPYSQAIDDGRLVWVSGQVGLDPKTGEIPGDVRREVELVLANLEAALAPAGLGLGDVVKTTIYLTGFGEVYEVLNEIWTRTFARPYPARATLQVAGLVLGARVEVEAVALRSKPS